ncbi:DegT/DnrJ/EryC1/StrS family aminotransferase [Fodinicola feengrottensis]|uniref:DegT/DnrJ/EryC1/StrS family aminotransferase n=1 Tax=Fodinicola feengrottensis TaxID=435914 RepID=UPI00244278B7|nr:DegT/DnrJ/EryC1/StrS family aminotransferase [Fodinicola feengrottensis]
MRRRRCAGHRRRPADRAGGPRHSREGHRPGPVLSWPGGQILLAGPRVELPPVRAAAAAYLLGQLESFERIQEKRGQVWSAYDQRLAVWACERGVRRPTVPAGCVQPAHLYYLLLPNPVQRDDFLRHLSERGVRAVHHYQPLHNAPAGLRHARVAPGGCSVTEEVADVLVRLPLFSPAWRPKKSIMWSILCWRTHLHGSLSDVRRSFTSLLTTVGVGPYCSER